MQFRPAEIMRSASRRALAPDVGVLARGGTPSDSPAQFPLSDDFPEDASNYREQFFHENIKQSVLSTNASSLSDCR